MIEHLPALERIADCLLLKGLRSHALKSEPRASTPPTNGNGTNDSAAFDGPRNVVVDN
jgi:hypothetical protein